MKVRASQGKRSSGTVLVDMLVGLMLSSMLVAMTGWLCLFGSRNFGAMGNYTELVGKSRNGLELRSRDLRPASQLTGLPNSGSAQWLRLTNAVAGTQIVYRWKAIP